MEVNNVLDHLGLVGKDTLSSKSHSKNALVTCESVNIHKVFKSSFKLLSGAEFGKNQKFAQILFSQNSSLK